MNRQPNLHLKQQYKELKKKKQKKKTSTRKELMKLRVELIEKEMKETIEKMNKTRSWFFENINKN